MPAQTDKAVPATENVNLYEVLGLPPPRTASAAVPTDEEIKAAYRRALLKYHPDKLSRAEADESRSDARAVSAGESPRFSIDNVRQAFDVLTSPALRREYDRALQLSCARSQTGSRVSDQRTTELDALDLDELVFDDAANVYFVACRCGNARGFEVHEDELLDVSASDADASAGEVLLECPDCSHHVRVTFSLMEDAE